MQKKRWVKYCQHFSFMHLIYPRKMWAKDFKKDL